MLNKRLIPVLLLKSSGLYKTKKFNQPVYVGDPRNTIKIFNSKEVDELCIMDITATNEGKGPNFELISELTSECFMPVSYGGGITSMDEIRKLFSLGVEKVILNSVVFSNPDLVVEASKVFGSQSIVVSIDVKSAMFRGYKIYSHSGSKKQKVSLEEHITNICNLGIGEIIVTSIDKEGTQSGMDLKLLEIVSKTSTVPVVAVGGVGTENHIKEAFHGCDIMAVGVGSFVVFQGRHNAVLVTYPERSRLDSLIN